jgi:hypothetical protein
MIAGAALAVLGLAAAKGTSLTPFQVRAILSDANLSTASVNGSADKIGVMPDLRKIIDSPVLSNPPPDITAERLAETSRRSLHLNWHWLFAGC